MTGGGSNYALHLLTVPHTHTQHAKRHTFLPNTSFKSILTLLKKVSLQLNSIKCHYLISSACSVCSGVHSCLSQIDWLCSPWFSNFIEYQDLWDLVSQNRFEINWKCCDSGKQWHCIMLKNNIFLSQNIRFDLWDKLAISIFTHEHMYR